MRVEVMLRWGSGANTAAVVTEAGGGGERRSSKSAP